MDHRSVLADLQAIVRDLQETPALFQLYNFAERVQAQDRLEFRVQEAQAAIEAEATAVDRMEYEHIRREADDLYSRLESINPELIHEMRLSIRSAKYTHETLWETLENCLGPLRGAGLEISSAYDDADELIHRLLHVETNLIPEETRARDEEMVFYQPTPARALFKLLEWAPIKSDDVFYDLGSGLGRVAIMVKLLTGATVKGIEIEPTFCRYARECARELNLQDIFFINQDARLADYSDGSIFYMYTPFRGRLLEEVLDRLRIESSRRRITVCTYGPCTREVSNADWLTAVNLHKDWQSGLGVFQAGA